MYRISTHHSTVWRWGETTVNREKAAADENLPRQTMQNKTSGIRPSAPHFDGLLPLPLLHPTWMSSSLLSNSDTRTFFPSVSLVRDTQSLPEAWRWASAGSFSSRTSCTVRSRLKVGWKIPRVCFLASLATVSTSTQNCSEEEIATKSVMNYSCTWWIGLLLLLLLLVVVVVVVVVVVWLVLLLLFLLF